MLVLGLTGSVGMGKSTCAEMFAALGVPIFNADREVHRLYSGPAVPLIEAAFPGTVVDGVVDRGRLGDAVFENPPAMAKLEQIVHPLVRESEIAFRKGATAEGSRIVLLDIPLLFEAGGESRVDIVIVVSTAPEVQKTRVMRRPGMTEERFAAISEKQMPDAEKRRRAHFIVDTTGSFDDTRRQVADILRAVAGIAAGR
jgi:dephospho-CoA kinase